jgi:hypothetical protein
MVTGTVGPPKAVDQSVRASFIARCGPVTISELTRSAARSPVQ